MLELNTLSIQQDGFRLAANFSVNAGEAVAILGPSGGGKSTLLMALAGFMPLSSGSLRWNGSDISTASPAERPVSMLFQEHNLFPHLDIAQNVGLGLRPDLKLSKANRVAVSATLTRVGLQGKEAHLPHQLSGGQRSRASLARVLLRQKPVLLLDEPFAALGPALRKDMLALVEEIRAEQNVTLLLVTHNPDEIKHFAEKCVFVDGGDVQPPVQTSQFFAEPSEAFKRYMGN